MKVMERLARFLPHPHLKPQSEIRDPKAVERIICFARLPNPTFDYYFAARLSAPDAPPYEIVDIKSFDPEKLDARGAFVVICRYANRKVTHWLTQNDRKLSGVGLFLDDDIAATVVSEDASLRYRLALIKRALLPLYKLNRHLDLIWASTPILAARIGMNHCRVLPPLPPADMIGNAVFSGSTDRRITIAYHATAIHLAEHRFLQPIVKAVLQARDNVDFEVFAARRAADYWKDLERVTIKKPLSWPDYLAESGRRQLDIMLVPLLASLVNDCRSPTKKIETARFGAAGIFSASPAYATIAEPGELLLPNEESRWIGTILDLVDNRSKRLEAALATRRLVQRMAANPVPLFPRF